MKALDWIILITILLLIAVSLLGRWSKAKQDDAFRQSCAAQGYYAIITRDARACVDERVIRYEETR